MAVNLSNHVTYAPMTDSHHPSPSPPSASFDYTVQDILQIILKSRKNWRTLKGQSEAVWPPYLEATMLKALQEYEPDNSRETRMLGRFPMRNRFISDYIHRTTGKHRSAKQVGSRLQQLRDTSEGRKLIDVLTRCYHTQLNTCNAHQPATSASSSSPSPSTISCDTSSPSSLASSPAPPTRPTMRPFPTPRPRQPAESRMPVYIDIAPPQSHSLASYSPLDASRQICNIDPTVTFVSPSPVNGRSSYIVLLDGAPVHSEDTTLECVGPYFASSAGRTSGDEPMLYNTPLVPKYWDVLCQAADPTLYTIVQDVHCVPDRVPGQSYAQRPRPVRIFSAVYHFQYPSPTDPTPSYEHPPMDVLSGGTSITSVFNDQTLSGGIPMDTTQSFPVPSPYSCPTSEGLRTPTEMDQNLLDEPFMLDVNFEQIAFDDFVANIDNPSTFFM